MKLSLFIKKLKVITRKAGSLQNIDVVMADNLQVEAPILQNGKVYITDVNDKKIDNMVQKRRN